MYNLQHNLTIEQKSLTSTRQIVKFSLYIAIGAPAALFTFLTVFAIARDRKLRRRKAFLIIGALALADFVDAVATILAGSYRLCGLTYGWAFAKVHVIRCTIQPYSLLWRWSDSAIGFMLVAVSLDRLLAVAAPLRYFKYETTYAKRLIAIFYALSVGNWLLAWIEPLWDPGREIYALCDAVVVAPYFYQYSKYLTACLSALSVLFYGVVIFMLEQRMDGLGSYMDTKTLDLQRTSQKKLTVTLGISSVCTLFFDAIPRAWGMYMYAPELNVPDMIIQGHSVAPYLFLINKLNAIVNFFLLVGRHSEIRRGMRFAFGLATRKISRRRYPTLRASQIENAMLRPPPATTNATPPPSPDSSVEQVPLCRDAVV
uniref:G-protein coupled receptors family 1 profile domain-containing protein n=1 Tax=Plectus sambesii TaxID=2011161 RepID=A0A914VH48_9BILA